MDIDNSNGTAIEDVSINHLLVNGLVDEFIINIILQVPRSNFLPKDYKSLGNSDGVVFINKQRFVIEITTMASILSLITKSVNKALVIGSALGYGSAVISKVAKKVVSVEEDLSLVEDSRNNLSKIGISNVNVIHDDIINFNLNEKFDLIVVEGAFQEVEEKWLEYLNVGGTFIGIERDRNISKIVRILKVEGKVLKTVFGHVATPYLPRLEGKNNFVF